MKNIAIIQARTNSSRVKHKVLQKVGSVTIIEWVLSRVLMAKGLDRIIVSVPNADIGSELDLALNQLKKDHNFLISYGPELNVHERFCLALKKLQVNKEIIPGNYRVLRVCADRPFIDPRLIECLLEEDSPNSLQFNHHNLSGSGFGFGAELIGRFLSEDLFFGERNKTANLEHVTLSLYQDQNVFKIYKIPELLKSYLSILSKTKFDADTEDEIAFLNRVTIEANINPQSTDLLERLSKAYD